MLGTNVVATNQHTERVVDLWRGSRLHSALTNKRSLDNSDYPLLPLSTTFVPRMIKND